MSSCRRIAFLVAFSILISLGDSQCPDWELTDIVTATDIAPLHCVEDCAGEPEFSLEMTLMNGTEQDIVTYYCKKNLKISRNIGDAECRSIRTRVRMNLVTPSQQPSIGTQNVLEINEEDAE